MGLLSDNNVLLLLVLSAVLSALVSVIDDCDEVFNYWEPVHLLLYGSGFQTWEYSPEFALRSYWYPGAMALLGYPFSLVLPKLYVFFVLRIMLGLLYAGCAMFFYRCVRHALGLEGMSMSSLLAVGLIACPGLFTASTALLPNALTMCIFMLSFGCWMRGLPALAVIFGAIGAFLGVPFAAIVLIPMALQVFLNEKLVALFVWACIGGVVSLLPQLLIDRYFYGKWVCAVCNIIKYNALDNDSTLYGVEPVSFYIKNLLLNLNLFFPMAVLSIVFALLAVRRDLYLRNWIIISPVPWLVFMFAMPHKEQRFLYPVYPLLLAAGAAVFRIFPSRRVNLPFLCGLLCVAVVATSGARLAALNSRSGSMTIWRHVQPLNNKTICLGDEWYRFPSSFWLPNDSVRVEFVRAGFRGLLPKHFASSANATSAVPSHMNNKNSEERSRYVDLSRCDYIVEEETESSSDGPVLARTRILDESRTSSFSRAFRVPFVTRAQSKGYQIRILK